MNTGSQKGFSLLELFMTLIVAGVILGIGVPNLMEFQRNNAISGAANEFVTAVFAARSESVKRGVPVTLCASADPFADPPVCAPTGAGTNGGFVVWVDDANPTQVDAGEAVLQRIPAPGGAIGVVMDGGYLALGSGGFARDDVVVNTRMTRLLYCDDRGRRIASGGRSTARLIQVLMTGRAEVLSDADLIAARVGGGFDCP